MAFFKDGKQTIDYIIVVKDENVAKLRQYIKNLQDIGLSFEITDGIEIEAKFIKVHAPQTALDHFSLVYDVGDEDQKPDLYKKKSNKLWDFMTTPISAIPPPTKGKFEDCQRIGIVNEILENTRYGEGPQEVGLTNLILSKVIDTAYPLHSGPVDTNEEPMNDRKLLLKHFANIKMWYKEMPLDQIKNYFGHEVAFYFAWLEFFDLMLIIPAILSVIFTLAIAFTLFTKVPVVDEYCEVDDTKLCPAVLIKEGTPLKPLSSYCSLAKIQYVFDNYLSIIFAAFISIWATVFLNYWRRKESKLCLKWGVNYDMQETTLRTQYLQHVEQVQQSGKWSFSYKMIPTLRMLFSFFICFLLVMVVIIACVAIIVIKILIVKFFNLYGTKFMKRNAKLLSMLLSAALQVVFIRNFGRTYGKLSLWLTDIENPRTQSHYDNSVLYKRYLLAFTNNYSSMFYIAFLKGRFYTKPNKNMTFMYLLERDICDPVNCIPDLCIAVAFVMLFKKLTGNALTYLSPYTNMLCNLICCKKVEFHHRKLPQWEEEYKLLPTNQFLLTTEFTEMITQYGFVTFFVAALPLTPFFCLLNNLLEARLDAFKLVTRFRRPVPRKKSGVGAWNGVLLGLTFMSVVTNGFVIGFTSDIVPRTVYRFAKDTSLKGFVNSTLSQYVTKELRQRSGDDICYYRGSRYGPYHKLAYQFTDEFWKEIAYRLIFVLIFEHIIFVCVAILDYAIPDVPNSVKLVLSKDKAIAREEKLKEMNEKPKPGKSLGHIGLRLKGVVAQKLPEEKGKKPDYDNYPQIAPITGFW